MEEVIYTTCPICNKRLMNAGDFAIYCSSYGDRLPWLTEEDIKKGLTYETKYPNGCGYFFMGG